MFRGICNKGKCTKGKAICGILTGTILGLFLGFLFAPRSGKETRKEILEKASGDINLKTSELKVKVKEKAENAQEEFHEFVEKVEKAQEEIHEISEEIKEKVKEKVQEKVKEKVKTRKEKKKVTVHIDELENEVADDMAIHTIVEKSFTENEEERPISTPLVNLEEKVIIEEVKKTRRARKKKTVVEEPVVEEPGITEDDIINATLKEEL